MSVYDLTGRKALVTGGARGLGAGMAEALARAGAAVVIGDIREELGEATVDAIKKTGGDAAFLPLNVTDDQSWARCVEGTIAELGGLDILVNNAGVEITQLVVDLDPDDIRKMLDVNILAPRSASSTPSAPCVPAARPAAAAPWSTSRRSPPRSRSPASPSTRRPSPRSTG